MATVSHHLNACGGLSRKVAIVSATAVAAITTACNTSQSASAVRPASAVLPVAVEVVSQTHSNVDARPTYGWPLKPFDRPHPVRAYLNDPRILGPAKSFHFGIDIGVPKGRQIPVYAVEAGTARIVSSEAIMVWGRRTFGYWHIVPAVRAGEFVRRHQLIGRSLGWNHIHFAEYSRGNWINPLRPGGLGPYVDATVPTVTGVTFERNGIELDREHLTGTCKLVLEAYDTAASVAPAPWPVTPAFIRWRVSHDGRPVTPWKRILDSRTNIPKTGFGSVYAAGTAQNHPGVPGLYRFLLAGRWSTKDFPNRRYAIEVQAKDIRGNSVWARVSFVVENGL
jgi:murein DD-endopeptidase MepM/ murein hydrolase activator NlpD